MSGEIRQYIRRNRNGKTRTKVGLLMARKVDGVPVIFWSLCRAEDKFDVVEAVRVAEQGYLDRFNRPIPRGIADDYNRFSERVSRYFKLQYSL